MRVFLLFAAFATVVGAQGVQPPPAPWRGAGPTPCVGSDGGILQCPPAARVVAIRAGRMFNSKTGQMQTKQVIVLAGERITEVGPEAQIKIPVGSQVIDLSRSTVLPGLIDAHTHMFNTRGPKGTSEESMLIAVMIPDPMMVTARVAQNQIRILANSDFIPRPLPPASG